MQGECCACQKPFNNEPGVSAMGKAWHKHCFVCTHCGNQFTEDKKFAQKDGSPYHMEVV